MFLRAALEKILADRDTKKPQNAQLKKAVETALDELNLELKAYDSHKEKNVSIVPNLHEYVQADKYFLPFELACQSRSPKIMVTAVDCLQKLIAYGHLTGASIDASNPERLLIDRIIDAICGTFSTTDETIQLQIIKALLTIVSSNACEVHEASLLLAVRTCFNIFLVSKNKVNQATAKATLTQMLSIVFQRMEQHFLALESTAESEANISSVQAHRVESENVDMVVANVLEELVNDVCLREASKQGNAIVDQENESSRAMSRAESIISDTDHLKHSHNVTATGNVTFDHVLQKDAFLLLRALCRLSMKPTGDGADPRMALSARVLSLQLILSVIQNPGRAFRTQEVFIVAIKQYLCVALSKNVVSNEVEVFELSLAIFLSLMDKLKQHLKVQIEVFFKDIFLMILESLTTSFEHKWLVMQALARICQDAQSVVDIYVNYDCDLNAANVFKRLIDVLAKYAQAGAAEVAAASHHNTAMPITPAQLQQQARVMRLHALQCLANVLVCMRQWASAEMEVTSAAPLFDATDRRFSTTQYSDLIEDQRNESSVCLADISAMQSSASFAAAKEFETLKQHKDVLEKGIELFNAKPKKGLVFFQERNLLGKTAQDVAKFLREEDRLDKSVVGDYLGEGETFNKEVMYAYVDMIDFTDKDFVSALRLFLESFRLPGEAQKIDRLMEKFASRYCENNPNLGIFASADTAYVLAYSIIMLTTDLHSAQVKNKMTRQQYINMNRGINDSADLPEEYLSAIYEEISGNEIRMKPGCNDYTSLLAKQNLQQVNEKQRRLLADMEMEQLSLTARSLMEAASHVQVSFTSAQHAHHVRPMFRTCWSPCLAAFSIALQGSDDEDLWNTSLLGFKNAIHISGLFKMEVERDAYMQALARFTLLTARTGLSEMKAKNIGTIKALIEVALESGNYLDQSWFEVLKCISQLELAQLLSTGIKGTKMQIPSPFQPLIFTASHSETQDKMSPSSYVARSSGLHLDHRSQAMLQESLGETSTQSVVVAVDKIFTSTTHLDGSAIVQFVNALVQVSREELSGPNPRMFTLQKIVEISYYNMGRIRLQWSRIWAILGEHFNQAGCNLNEEVALFAVDSLRQLSMKFLERGELPNFRFQKEFMRPFEVIMKRNKIPMIRDMVCRCMHNMVNSHANNIMSGWKNIFSVFHQAASENDDTLIELSFSTTQDIVLKQMTVRFGQLLDSFQECVKCLSEFACNANYPDMCMEAIRLIRICANYVSDHRIEFRDHQWESDLVARKDHAELLMDEKVWLRGWLPIMFELSTIIARSKLDVRTRSLTVMFEIMKTFGNQFKQHWWHDLFQVAFRIFDVMKLPESRIEKNEWMMTTCNHALYAIVDVFTQYYIELSTPLDEQATSPKHRIVSQRRSPLQSLYAQLYWCCQQENEQLARSSINCIENFTVSNGSKFNNEIWENTVELLLNIAQTTEPHSLLTWQPEETIIRTTSSKSDTQVDTDMTDILAEPQSPTSGNKKSNQLSGNKCSAGNLSNAVFDRLLVQCVVQLELVDCIHSIIFGPGSTRADEKLVTSTSSISSQCDSNLMMPASTSHQRQQHQFESSFSDDKINQSAMYQRINSRQLFNLIDCLLNQHQFAKEFNANQQQRTVLWKAGFKGRTKPNLVRQEVRSLRTALKILFCMYADKSRPKNDQIQVQNRLVSTCREALNYFKALESEQHREAWLYVIHLILEQCNSSDTNQFAIIGSELSEVIIDLIDAPTNLKAELRTMLKQFVKRLLELPFNKSSNLPIASLP